MSLREIKFRGKRVDNGEWVYGWYIKAKGHWNNKGVHEDWIICHAMQNGGWFALGSKYPVMPETIGQYTGLKDKNGVEIYEGDLLKTEENEIYRVAFIESNCAFVACFYPDDYDTVYLTDTVPNTYDEVIGNIHDKGG